MHPGSPVTQFLAVALPAKPIRFLKRDRFTASQVECVAVAGVVAVEAPTMCFVMLEDDLRMHL
jgi:hypothetical protein